MTNSRKNPFPASSFSSRLSSMLRVDSRRMFGTPLFWICLGIAFAVPILVLVMTKMTGEEGGMMFSNTWQIIASEGGNMMAGLGAAMGGSGGMVSAAQAASGAGMLDMTSMMNINLMYFMAAIFTCLFVADDFRSGYCKNLFTVRAPKSDYVASKTILCTIAGALFLIAFFIGAVVGGGVAGLSFDPGTAGGAGIAMCLLAKVFLMTLFVAIALLVSTFGKGRTWLSILLALFAGMLLFMMIPMMTPLDAGMMNVGMCLAGGVIFAIALGAVSNIVLKRTPLV